VIQVGQLFGECDVLLQQTQTPPIPALGRLGTRQRDHPGFDLTGDDRRDRRRLPLLPGDGRLHVATPVGISLRDLHDRVRADPSTLGDDRLSGHGTIPVGVVLIQSQQDSCPADLLCRVGSGAGQPGQHLPVGGTEPDRA
jgi:hypothetical protein